MKVKLDENIPHTVRRRLAPLGLDVDTVLDEGLGGRRGGRALCSLNHYNLDLILAERGLQ